jgi:hypothetical protein
LKKEFVYGGILLLFIAAFALPPMNKGGEKRVIKDIKADAYILIQKIPQAKLSFISVEETLSNPLSYQVRLNTENKDLLTKKGDQLSQADILFNRTITEMWSKTYCRSTTSDVIKKHKIQIFTASLNNKGITHSIALCD